MVERSPSGLYTSVFSVLYCCGESFWLKIAACRAAIFCKSFAHKKDAGVHVFNNNNINNYNTNNINNAY